MSLTRRGTIYLDPDLHRAVRMKATETEKSVSDLVNASVRHRLAEDADDLAAFRARAKEPHLDGGTHGSQQDQPSKISTELTTEVISTPGISRGARDSRGSSAVLGRVERFIWRRRQPCHEVEPFWQPDPKSQYPSRPRRMSADTACHPRDPSEFRWRGALHHIDRREPWNRAHDRTMRKVPPCW